MIVWLKLVFIVGLRKGKYGRDGKFGSVENVFILVSGLGIIDVFLYWVEFLEFW